MTEHLAAHLSVVEQSLVTSFHTYVYVCMCKTMLLALANTHLQTRTYLALSVIEFLVCMYVWLIDWLSIYWSVCVCCRYVRIYIRTYVCMEVYM